MCYSRSIEKQDSLYINQPTQKEPIMSNNTLHLLAVQVIEVMKRFGETDKQAFMSEACPP